MLLIENKYGIPYWYVYNIEYFLNRPYGNHHVVIYGDYKNDIIKYMSKLWYKYL